MKTYNTKRAQAALEFLTTYGWAFLVILIMIGALAYFGVLNPSNLVPDSCSASSGFTCTEYKATESTTTDSVSLVVVNSIESIDIAAIDDISVNELSTTGCSLIAPVAGDITVGGAGIAFPATVEKGSIMTFNLNCAAASDNISPDERIQGNVDIVYTPVGKTLAKTATIDFSLKAQP